MKKVDIIKIIEDYAPLELQEKWDCSGFIVETAETEINRILLALTVTPEVIKQAIDKNCDMIISHHPLFFVPLWYKGIQIYASHTNMDKTLGGTTDTLIELLGFDSNPNGEFLRYIDLNEPILVKDFAKKLKKISPNLKYVNNFQVEKISKIAFCAGSGIDYLKEAQNIGADCFVTGDIKYHSAIESNLILFDIGHFESEIHILKVFENLLQDKVEVYVADEESPFKNI